MGPSGISKRGKEGRAPQLGVDRNNLMRALLYIVAGVAIILPFGLWAYLVLLACAFATSGNPCSITIGDFWDGEFLAIAAIPWLIGAACFYAARRR